MSNVAAVRRAEVTDVPAMREILNEIIVIGGTTAFETPLSEADVQAWMLNGPKVLFCHVALDDAGAVAGFQYMSTTDEPGIGSIASFARQTPVIRGVGRALFQATLAASRDAGLSAINAKIRGDNVPGLGYYSKMGFVDHHVVPGVPLNDGTPVDRVVKRLQL